MYLCSLLPEGKSIGVGNCIETSVTGTWQGSIIHESIPFVQDDFVLVFKAGSDVVSMKASDMGAWRFWVPLLQSSFLVLRPVFLGKISKTTFHCIRLGLTEMPLDYSIKYFKHEAILSQILSRSCLYVEGPTTLSIKHTVFATKKKYIEDVYDGVPLAFGSNIDFMLSFITERKPRTISLDPIQVVTGHALAAKRATAMNLIGPQNALIITKTPEAYASYPGVVFNRFRISKADLETYHCFVLDANCIRDVLIEQDKDLKCFAEILGIATNTSPSESQVRRFFWNFFWTSRESSTMSVANVQWPVLLEDSVTTHDTFFYTKKVHLLEHEDLLPRWPTFSEIASIYNERDPQVFKAGFSIWSQFVTNLGLPKPLLRKIKLRLVHVRPTLAEQRLTTLHESLDPHDFHFLSDNKAHALLRLAPITLDKTQLLEVVTFAFQKKISFASLLHKTAFAGSESFLRTQILEDCPCCICREDSEQRTLSLCGHSFCQDCSIQVFGDSIRNAKKTTPCPYCREELACGDLFTLGPRAKSLCFCSKTLSLSKQNGLLIDEERLLGPVGSFGSAATFDIFAEKITLVSIQDHQRLLLNLLTSAASKTSLKVTALVGPTDTYGDLLNQYFG